MSVLAVDPGKCNLGIWLGDVDTKTIVLDKLDISDGPLYKSAVDTLSVQPWLSQVKYAVVETQEPRNIPARVIATSIYGYLRGLNIQTEFSSSRLKNDAIDTLSKKYSIPIKTKPTKEAVPDAKQRSRLMHKINKENSKAVVIAMLKAIGDVETSVKIESTAKKDDMCDALLLGLGMCYKLEKEKYPSHKVKK